MSDRLTQSSLLWHLPPWDEKVPFGTRFIKAWQALPQVKAAKYALAATFRMVECTLRWWYLRCSVRLFPRMRRTGRRLWNWLKNTRPGLAVRAWWASVKKAVRELPQYRFYLRIHRFFGRHPILHFALYMAILSAVITPWCLDHQEVAEDEHIYLLIDRGGFQVIHGYPTEDYTCDYLYTRAGSNTQDAQIILQDDQEIVIRRGEERFTTVTRRETVANLLRRMEITPAEHEMVAVNVAGKTAIIHIAEELRFERTETTPTPHGTYSYDNYLLEKGTTRVVQEGKEGVITDTYEDVYRMGELVSSRLVYRTDTSAVTEILEHGRLVTDMEQDCKAVEEHPYRDGREGGYLVFECGDSMTYSKKVTNNSTAYYGGPITATGHPVGMGVIAVDPKVYPYHTSMYIGAVGGRSYYGIGTAYDCGGAVKGNIIDLWYPTVSDCYVWGRRNVTCYILDAKDVT